MDRFDRPYDGALVTVDRFDSLPAAQIAKGRLEDEGIPALVMEQDLLRLNPFSPEPHPGIRLQVREEDLEASRRVLASEPPSAED